MSKWQNFSFWVYYPFISVNVHPVVSLRLCALSTHEHSWTPFDLTDRCLPFLPNQPWPPSAGSASWPSYGQTATRVRVDDSGQEKPIASAFRGAWCCCQWLWPGILLHSLLMTQTTHKTAVRYEGLAFASLTVMANHSGVNKTAVTALSTAYSLVVGWLCVFFF